MLDDPATINKLIGALGVGLMFLLTVLVGIIGFLIRSWINRVDRTLEKLGCKLAESLERVHARIDKVYDDVQQHYVQSRTCDARHGDGKAARE